MQLIKVDHSMWCCCVRQVRHRHPVCTADAPGTFGRRPGRTRPDTSVALHEERSTLRNYHEKSVPDELRIALLGTFYNILNYHGLLLLRTRQLD